MLYYRQKTNLKSIPLFGKGIALLCVVIFSIFFLSTPSAQTSMPKAKDQTDNPIPSSAPLPTQAPALANDLFSQPAVGVLTSNYGSRWGRDHHGIDIGAEHGSDILAAASGMVSFSGWVDGYGNYLVLDHENGYQTAYAHCDALLVQEGDAVTQGQIVAYVGNTGNSTGPHLHFEVKLDGVFQNPLNYVMY